MGNGDKQQEIVMLKQRFIQSTLGIKAPVLRIQPKISILRQTKRLWLDIV